jgi:hypothetical protein
MNPRTAAEELNTRVHAPLCGGMRSHIISEKFRKRVEESLEACINPKQSPAPFCHSRERVNPGAPGLR